MGYRLFGHEVPVEFSLIRTFKVMDMLLHDLRRILDARRSGPCICSSPRATIRTKGGESDQKIQSLQQLQQELLGLLSGWEDCGGCESASLS